MDLSTNRQQFQATLKTPAGNPLEEFMLQKGRYANFSKETLFIRYLSRFSSVPNQARLESWGRQPGCVFAPAIASQPPVEQVARYTALYGGGEPRLPFEFANRLWQEALRQGLGRITELFQAARGRTEESITRNFQIRILYMIDTYFPRLFVETAKMNKFPKFACGGTVKLPEYLFLCLLFGLGCDVLYISPDKDVAVTDPGLLALSLQIEEEPPKPPAQPQAAAAPAPAASRPVISMERIRRPDRQAPPPPARPSAPAAPYAPASRPPAPAASRQPLEFEELARFAASVTMLKVFDKNDQCFKSGSGVIINEKGYVLTNFHVVSGGAYYGILLEEETDVFYTDELIKYHPDFDLAVLRMEKRRQPIPLANDAYGKLVRGQKVVAIGSPLGLFNSVSNGIISGFRDMEKVSMIQFTAPVSHGSSGGALLNMYGEMIGLITAGYDDGQNLNLAVGYQTIAQFVRGLL